jgi:Zn-finger nucleic acid-binding protein
LFSGNPENRCYYCKSELFKKLRVIADKEGVANVVDGTTLSDAGDYRPGRQAAKESGARSPLLETGLGKEEVRAISQFLGLPTAAKPAYACLASRFPYGEEITTEKLKMVGEAEDFLRTLGFQIIRVRHHREIARIEVACEEMTRLADPDTRDRIIQKFHSLGYLYVTIDLEGYRSGSMNKKIANAVRPDVYRGATAEMESRDNIGSYLTCPRCLEEQLKEMVTPEVHYFQCSHCGGIWFGLNELEKALGKNAKFTMPSGVDATEYLPRAAKPACPVCQTALVRIKALDVPDLEVDACLVCQGRWVDGREISRHQKQGLFTHLKDFVMRLF